MSIAKLDFLAALWCGFGVSLEHFNVILILIKVHTGPRFHLFPRDPGKYAVQGPTKLSEDEVRGQFCRPEDCIFPRDPEEKGEIFTLYPGFDCFPSSILFTNCGILGVLYFNIPRFPNRGDIGNQ